MEPTPILSCSLTAALLSTALTTGAQVLSPLNAIPLVGDTFMTRSVDFGDPFDPGPAGVGSIWDFSDFVIDDGTYLIHACVDPATAPGYAAFPTCDMVLKGWPGPGISAVFHDYFDQQVDGAYKLGRGDEAWVYTYGTPDLDQAAPLNYGVEVNTVFCSTAIGFGDPIEACGATRQSLDGDGTLVLPYATFPYTVRTIKERYSVDPSAPMDTAFSTVYRWWAPQVRWPILEMGSYTDTSGAVLYSTVVLDPALFTGVEELEEVRSRAYPVPFRDRLTIDVRPAVLQAGPVFIRTVDGRLVHTASTRGGTAAVTLDLGHLPPGTYLVEVMTNRGRIVHTTTRQP